MLGTTNDNNQFIETVSRHGYRFVGDVKEIVGDEEIIVVEMMMVVVHSPTGARAGRHRAVTDGHVRPAPRCAGARRHGGMNSGRARCAAHCAGMAVTHRVALSAVKGRASCKGRRSQGKNCRDCQGIRSVFQHFCTSEFEIVRDGANDSAGCAAKSNLALPA